MISEQKIQKISFKNIGICFISYICENNSYELLSELSYFPNVVLSEKGKVCQEDLKEN